MAEKVIKIGLDNRMRGQGLENKLDDIDNLPEDLDTEPKKKVTPQVEEEEIEVMDEEDEIEAALSEDDDEEVEEVEDVEEEIEEEETPKKKIKKKQELEDDEEEIDYKKKFSESSSEAMNLHFRNEKLNKTIQEAANLPEPTEAELKDYAKEQGAEWDELDAFSKNILKKTYASERKFDHIQKAQAEAKKFDDRAKKIDNFLDDPDIINKYPSLSSHDAEFKKFAMRESRNEADLEDLVGSFLYKLQLQAPVKRKGSLLLNGGNGSNPKPAAKQGYTAEQIARIRTRKPKLYMKLNKAGKINIDF